VRIEWTPAAEEDRVSIRTYIAAEDIGAAVAIFPSSAPRGIVSGTRELVPHPNYRLVYEIKGDVVRILSLVHVSRQWPPPEEF
jgi:plasmid stabilization system protein ParE